MVLIEHLRKLESYPRVPAGDEKYFAILGTHVAFYEGRLRGGKPETIVRPLYEITENRLVLSIYRTIESCVK